MIKTVTLRGNGQTFRDDPWIQTMLQHRIDKTQLDLGPLFENCDCRNCFAETVLINNIIYLADSLNLPSVDFEIIKLNSKRGKLHVREMKINE